MARLCYIVIPDKGDKGMTTIGKNIRYFREMRGYSQTQLAHMVGYTDRSSIAKVETGKNDLVTEMVAEFARALGVSPLMLLMNESEFKEMESFLPYLAKADKTTLNNIRAILGMPIKD